MRNEPTDNPYEIAARIVDAEAAGALALVEQYRKDGKRASSVMMQHTAIILEATAHKIRKRGENYATITHDFTEPAA